MLARRTKIKQHGKRSNSWSATAASRKPAPVSTGSHQEVNGYGGPSRQPRRSDHPQGWVEVRPRRILSWHQEEASPPSLCLFGRASVCLAALPRRWASHHLPGKAAGLPSPLLIELAGPPPAAGGLDPSTNPSCKTSCVNIICFHSVLTGTDYAGSAPR